MFGNFYRIEIHSIGLLKYFLICQKKNSMVMYLLLKFVLTLCQLCFIYIKRFSMNKGLKRF